MSTFYNKHIFFCTTRERKRTNVLVGVEEVNSLRLYMKEQIKLSRIKGIRVIVPAA